MIDKGEISSILAEMKALRTQANPMIQPIEPPRIDKLSGVSKSDSSGFGDLLKGAIDSVNDEKMKAGALQNAYQLGDPNVDLPQVMIQMQKSSVAFEAVTQVRNRLVRAYEEIMSMGI